MEALSRRRPRRRRWTPALLLAVVALAFLAVAGPAVAKPGHAVQAPGATLSAAGTIAVIASAVILAVALVAVAFLTGRREDRGNTVVELRGQKQVRRRAGHGVAA